MTDIAKFRKQIRTLLADYMWAEGCSCCRSNNEHEAAKKALAKLLNVPEGEGGGWYDFSKYRAKEKV